MSEKFSVTAVLSAYDKGFTAGMKNAQKATMGLSKTIKGGLGFGLMAGAGAAAFQSITTGVKNLVSEISNSGKAWKTFEGNMKIIEASGQKLEMSTSKVRNELSKFATQTIYSASDMASTYAQLAAVGTDNTLKLVKGFAGLAAAAENPKQAMKTLSQQATQMAARPTVAWQDFKLMLDQTPAGIAAVARQMGMSADELTAKIQKGEVATKDFFKAVEVVGNSKGFRKLATQYKSVDEAMDGLRETLGVKLAPAFAVLERNAIKGISSIIDWVDKLNSSHFAAKLAYGLKQAGKYFDIIKNAAIEVKDAFATAFSAIGDSLAELDGAFGSTKSLKGFAADIGFVKNALKILAEVLRQHATIIAFLIRNIPALIGTFIAFKVVKTLIPILSGIGGALKGLLPKLFNFSKGTEKAGKSSKKNYKSILQASNAFMRIGAGLLMVSAGFALLAYSAVKIAEAGPVAAGVMLALTGAVAGLALGMMKMMSSIKSTPEQMNAMSKGMIAFGVAMIMIAGAMFIMSKAAIGMANAGPGAIVAMAVMGAVVAGLAVVFAKFGASLQKSMGGIIVFAAAVSLIALAMYPLASTGKQGAIAMAAFGAVVAALVVVFGVFGTALNAAIPAMLVFGATILMVGAGMALASILVKALTPFIKQLGDTISQVAATIADALTQIIMGFSFLVSAIGNAVSQIVTAIGDTLVSVFRAAGEAISQVVTSISEGFQTICNGVSTVVEAISGGFTSVLEAVANIIESVGISAKNAGDGFLSVANGIQMIADISFKDIAKSLGAVALGMGKMAKSGEGLTQAAAGMKSLMLSISMASAAVAVLNMAFMLMGQTIPMVASGITMAAAGVLLFCTNATMAAVGVMAFGSGLLVAAVGVMAFGASSMAAVAGLLAMGAALFVAAASLSRISSGASSARAEISGIQSALWSAASAASNFGAIASASLAMVTAAFKSAAATAKQSGQQVGQGFTQSMRAGLAQAPSIATTAVNSANSAFRSGRGGAYAAGAYISQGFAAGMRSCLGEIRAAAAAMAAAADEAVRAKAKIQSPSKMSEKLGKYWGSGWVIGILSKVKDAWKAAEKLVSVPTVATPDLTLAYAGELSSDYEYFQNAEYVIEVPLSVDGKEFARATATYTREELDRKQSREDRKHGRI